MAFKMKGFPQHKGISPMKKDTDPTVKGETKETVTVTDKKGHERGQDKLNRVKTQTQSMAEGNQAANLSKEYGGNWKQANNPNAPGSGKQWLNDEGETVRESATRQGQEYNKNKRKYQAANTTKKPGAPKKTDPKNQSASEKHDKQQNIADPNSGYWPSGKPKKYQTLQDDGTYTTVTNQSGSSSKTAKQLKNTHVTKKEAAAAREQHVQNLITKTNEKNQKKANRKAKIRSVKKKIVSAIKDPLGVKYRNKKRIEKAYNEGMDS